MSFFKCRRSPCGAYSWRALVLVVFVTAVVGITYSLPAEKVSSTTTSSTTTEKLLKHPSYVRVLKQGNGNTKPTPPAPTEPVLTVEESQKSETVTAAKNDSSGSPTGPRTISTLSKNLTTEEIRNIIPFLNFETPSTTQRPSSRPAATATRAPRTGVFDILTRVFDSIRGVGNSLGRNRGSNRTLLSAFRGSGDNVVAESKIVNGTAIGGDSGKSSDSNRGPGGILLRVLQMIQNASITVENMVMGFVNFFDRSSSSRNSIQ